MGIATAITAAATVGGAIIGSKSSKKAAQTVSDATDQQVALQREIYNDSVRRSEPFYQTGVQANAAAAELLGLGGGSGADQPVARDFRDLQPNPEQQYLSANPDVAQHYGTISDAERNWLNNNGYAGQEGWARFHYENSGQGEGRQWGGTPQGGQVRQFQSMQGGGTPSGLQYGYAGTAPAGVPNFKAGQGNPVSEKPTGLASLQGGGQTTSNGRPIYQNQQLNAITQSPGYEFRLQEGMNALETGAAARGGLLSGGHIRRGIRYGQDYASGEYNTRFNQLQALQGGGQAAVSNQQNAGANYAAGAGSAIGNNAAFAAQQQQQRGSIYGGALGSIAGGIAGAYG